MGLRVERNENGQKTLITERSLATRVGSIDYEALTLIQVSDNSSYQCINHINVEDQQVRGVHKYIYWWLITKCKAGVADLIGLDL